MHLTDYLKRNAKDRPTKPALVFEGQTITWEELWQKVEKASHYFSAKLGNIEQQVVCLLLTNSPEFVVTYLAVLHAGHIALPLDPAYKKLELDAIIEQIPPKIIVTEPRYEQQISHHPAKTIKVDELLKTTAKSDKVLRLPADKQIASLTFTSGTTGKAKAVPNTHTNQLWNIEVCSKVWAWSTDDNLLVALPLSHWYGLVMGLAGMLYHGNTLYLYDQSFNTRAIASELATGKISIFSHLPVAYMKFLELDQKYNLSQVRLFISGGAPLPPAVFKEFKTRYGVEIIETYGSSETGRIAANNLNNRLAGSPGQLLPGVEIKISPEGEIMVKSPGIFPGYYRNRATTKDAWASGGWWRTGDLGEVKAGNVFLKGRLQERIRKFGFTISPRDVEWALQHHPKIKAVYVMGRQRPNEPNDELIYFIVGNITEPEIQDYCKENLVFAWRPDKVIFLDSLPRTAMGKPQLSKLRKLAEAIA